VRLVVCEEVERRLDEVVAVAGDQAASLRGSASKLFSIAYSDRPALVGAYGVDRSLA
jgi:hypothetical protein